MYTNYRNHLTSVLSEIKEAGLYKNERIIVSPQGAEIELNTGQKVLNFCANNYLGLSNDLSLIAAAKASLDDHGYGMSSVRFICGTTDLHKELERKIAEFFNTEDTILYAACFDANGGVFEPLLTEEDAIMRQSLMVSACAKLSATGMKMPIWQTWKNNFSLLSLSGSDLL
jgi:glycine C-acetyltransferase